MTGDLSEPGSILSVLDHAVRVDPDDMNRLGRGLAANAEGGAVLDIAYTTVDTPIGGLLLAATPLGLLRVAFDCEGFDSVLESLAEQISPRILRAPARLGHAARQLDDYFAGRLTRFDIPIDPGLSSGFRRHVQRYLPTIGYGHTASYAEIAREVGRPGAVRAVGSACATNPHPIVVPCHRVLRSDGSLGGYRGGLAAKTILLQLEGAR